MAEEEAKPEKPETPAKKKAKLEAPPPEPKAAAERPTPKDVRAAKKAQLVAWCEAFGLKTEGKVDELRARLLGYLEREVPGKPAEEKVEEAPRKPAKKPKEAKRKPARKEEAPKEKAEEPEEEEEVHVPKKKPKLDARTRRLLHLRAAKSAVRPPFLRQEWFRYDRLGEVWRKPQGSQSKLRRHFGYRWNLPSIGYRGPREVRGLHPSGFREVLVHNVKELEGIDPERQAVRIAHGVGARKREIIEKACDDREIRVLNRMVTE